MKFQETFDFDYPAEVILRMFGDKAYYQAKNRQMGSDRAEILDCRASGDQFRVTVRHALDSSRLKFPDFVKKRLGNQLYLEQTDTWELDEAEGRIDIVIDKAPVDIKALTRLNDTGSGSRLTLDFDITASIPLVGGKIEKAVAGPIVKHLRKDVALSNQMAAEYQHEG